MKETENEITNDITLNKEGVKMSLEEIMWEARRKNNRRLYAVARNELGLGKHWLQRKLLPRSRQWGGGIK